MGKNNKVVVITVDKNGKEKRKEEDKLRLVKLPQGDIGKVHKSILEKQEERRG